MDPVVILGVLGGLLVVWAAVVLVLWLLRPRNVPLRDLVRLLPDVVKLLWRLVRDPRSPRDVRLVVLGLIAWVVSPIDLVPEFVPVVGPFDDVIVAIVALRYVRRRIGEEELRRLWPGSDEGFVLLRRVLGSSPAAE